LGSNEGNRLHNLLVGARLISRRYDILAISSLYLSRSWGFKSRDFLNGVLLVRVMDNPFVVLSYLKWVEGVMGREPTSGGGYSDRPFDADILLWEGLTLRSPDLIIPHPRMRERDFVNVPLAELISRGYPSLGYTPTTGEGLRRVVSYEALRLTVPAPSPSFHPSV